MTKIKICGIKTLDDALAAAEAGADLLGFNFYPASPRFIDVHVCRTITSVLKSEFPTVQRVGVFVNASADAVRMILDYSELDLAQLHGDESPELFAALGHRAVKAFRGIPNGELQSYARNTPPAFLVDGSISNLYGGTGVAADWSAAAGLAKRYPFLLAGGLKPENVAEAVRHVQPWGVDVASGVEASPGRKDPEKINAFVQAVRSVDETGE
jgi:phosphoribosylanthranilate isomerase